MSQPSLPLTPAPIADDPDVQRLHETLVGRGWTSAHDILVMWGESTDEGMKRHIRAMAARSHGHIIGHQLGYKLTSALTQEEYTPWMLELEVTHASIISRRRETSLVFSLSHPAM